MQLFGSNSIYGPFFSFTLLFSFILSSLHRSLLLSAEVCALTRCSIHLLSPLQASVMGQQETAAAWHEASCSRPGGAVPVPRRQYILSPNVPFHLHVSHICFLLCLLSCLTFVYSLRKQSRILFCWVSLNCLLPLDWTNVFYRALSCKALNLLLLSFFVVKMCLN